MNLFERVFGKKQAENKPRTIVRSASYINYDDVVSEWVKRLKRCSHHKITVSWKFVNDQVQFHIKASKHSLKCVSRWLGAKIRFGKINYNLSLSPLKSLPEMRGNCFPANTTVAQLSAS